MADSGVLGWECVEALVSCNRHGRSGVADVSVSRDVRGTPPAGNCYGLIVGDDEKVVSDQELNSVQRSS